MENATEASRTVPRASKSLGGTFDKLIAWVPPIVRVVDEPGKGVVVAF